MSMHEVEQFVSGMTALMFAKFIMNDVPHALGLMGKKINAYTEYKCAVHIENQMDGSADTSIKSS